MQSDFAPELGSARRKALIVSTYLFFLFMGGFAGFVYGRPEINTLYYFAVILLGFFAVLPDLFRDITDRETVRSLVSVVAVSWAAVLVTGLSGGDITNRVVLASLYRHCLVGIALLTFSRISFSNVVKAVRWSIVPFLLLSAVVAIRSGSLIGTKGLLGVAGPALAGLYLAIYLLNEELMVPHRWWEAVLIFVAVSTAVALTTLRIAMLVVFLIGATLLFRFLRTDTKYRPIVITILAVGGTTLVVLIVLKSLSGNSFTSGRYEVWMGLLRTTLDRPWYRFIIGSGFGAVGKALQSYGGPAFSRPHNEFLQFWYNHGVLGLLYYVVILTQPLRTGRAHGLVVVLAFALFSLTDNIYYYYMLFFYLLAYGFSLPREHELVTT